MKQERLLAFQDFLVTQMNHWLLFSIAVTVLGLIGSERPLLWQWGLCSLLPLVFFLIRRYTDRFLLFFAGHALAAAALLVLPYRGWADKLLVSLYVIGYLIYSFYLRVKTEERLDEPLHPAFAVGIEAVALFLQHYQGNQEWDAYYVAGLLLFLGLYYIQIYLDQYHRFMVVNDSSTGRIPQKEMFKSGMTLAAMFAAGSVVLLLLTSNIGWVARIVSVLKMLLSWLVRLLFKNGGEEQEAVIEELTQTERAEDMFPKEPAEPFFLWKLLEKLAFLLIYCAIIALAVFCIYKLITFLYEHFQRTVVHEQAVLEAGADIREKCQVERPKKERRFLLGRLDARERIRRIYKKEIWAERRRLAAEDQQELLRVLTAKECGQRLDRQQLAQIYEKARYSDRECTAEDVKKAREK